MKDNITLILFWMAAITYLYVSIIIYLFIYDNPLTLFISGMHFGILILFTIFILIKKFKAKQNKK